MANPLLLISYATIAGLWVSSQQISINYVVHVLLLVTSILYAACHGSLTLREEQAYARGETPDDHDADELTEGEAPYETLKASDAAFFPVMGSVSLFGLYTAFKYFDKDVVNLIISVYFCCMGCMAIAATLSPIVEGVGSKGGILSTKFAIKKKISHPLPESIAGCSPWSFEIEGNYADVLSFILGLIFCGVYFKTKHWTMNNILGICFCLQGIERFSLGTFKIGAILLVGLFFYDIFWVFGTDVMVTVAKSLDGPIKILFPRSVIPDPTTGKLEMSLLGLGDIVIPGFFLALLLRFDAHNAKIPCFPTNVHVPFDKPYFHSALLGYVIGLGTTLYIMIAFEAAQPALLYLVPACLGSSLTCAFVRGEVKELFAYSEEEEESTELAADEKNKKNE